MRFAAIAIGVSLAAIFAAQLRTIALQSTGSLLNSSAPKGTPVPRLISFQGHVTRPVKDDPRRYEAVPDGRYDVLFTLYTAPVGGDSKVWGPEHHEKLVVVNGLINALIGSVDGGLEGIKPEQLAGPLYVGITIDAERNPAKPNLELVPRQVLLPAMYAHHSGRAATADHADRADDSRAIQGLDLFKKPEKLTLRLQGEYIEPSSTINCASLNIGSGSGKAATKFYENGNVEIGGKISVGQTDLLVLIQEMEDRHKKSLAAVESAYETKLTTLQTRVDETERKLGAILNGWFFVQSQMGDHVLDVQDAKVGEVIRLQPGFLGQSNRLWRLRLP